MRPKAALRGAGGAARGAASEQTRTAAAWFATERQQTRMLRKVEEAPEAPVRPEAASSAVLPQHCWEPADVRDMERAELSTPGRESRMRI